MNGKFARSESRWGRVAALGLGLTLISFSGCGDGNQSTAPDLSKTATATKPTPDSAKKATKKSRLEAPNADLGPKERRALKAKGQLPE